MTWRVRAVLIFPFVVAATLNVLTLIADPLHWRIERIAGYGFLFATPWAWLLDSGWIPRVNNKWLDAVITCIAILWIPALLYSGCLWLLIRAGKSLLAGLGRR